MRTTNTHITPRLVDPAALRSELALMPTEELEEVLQGMGESPQVRLCAGWCTEGVEKGGVTACPTAEGG